MKKIFLLVLILALMVACGYSPGKRYYQLVFEAYPGTIKPDASFPGLDKTILIEPVTVEEIYNDYHLVYRTSPYELNYYAYHFWIKRPDKLIRDVIFDYLTAKKIFSRIVYSRAEAEPDYQVKIRVNVIEEHDLKKVWLVRLNMEIEIRDFQSGSLLVFHRFDRRKNLPEKKVGRVPIALSQILVEEIDIVLKELLAKLQ